MLPLALAAFTLVTLIALLGLCLYLTLEHLERLTAERATSVYREQPPVVLTDQGP